MGLIHRLPESVVNRIAAGEVVVRPANAVKELIENSLDAGATEIVVSLKQGGIELLQVQDNGKGILKEDLELVCERFATSKLEQFEDLHSMKTYGFRGEALASISFVAKVTITSKPKEQPCAYQGKYTDGIPQSIRPSAGLDGTCVTAEDLFYNCPSRQHSFRNKSEETSRVADIVTRYAAHRPDVSFALRRGGSGNDFRTSGKGQRSEVIASLLGIDCSGDLVQVDHKSSPLQYTLTGCLTRPLSAVTARSVQAKKNRQKCFFLFINGRSVNCAPLKHCLDQLFAERDLVCPFMLLSIEMAASRVDVNVHPTKESVMFLEEDAIVDEIRKYIFSLVVPLSDHQLTPRSLDDVTLTTTQIVRIPSFTQGDRMKSSDSDTSQNSYSSGEKKRADHLTVRTDSRERRLDQYLSLSQEKENTADGGEVELVAVSASQSDEVTITQDEDVCRRVFSFESLADLRREVCLTSSQSLRDLFKSYTFVGCVSPELVLLQHTTSLYLINLSIVASEMFYQNLIFSFGNFGSFELEEPIRVDELYVLSGRDETDQCQENARLACELLSSHIGMLHDYLSFNLVVSEGAAPNFVTEGDFGSDEAKPRPDDGLAVRAELAVDQREAELNCENPASEGAEPKLWLTTIPSLINGYVPQLEGLPNLIYDLAREVDWDDETLCFQGVCRALANFFVIKEEYCEGDQLSGMDAGNSPWKEVIENVLLPRIKTRLIPQESFKDNGAVKRATDLHDLYKVFERC